MQYVIGAVVAGLSVAAVAVGLTAGREQAALAEQGAHLDGRSRATVQRCVDKYDAAAALVRGEVTAEAAADRFADILTAEPHILARLRAERPGASDRELTFLQLAKSVRAVGARDPGRVEDLARAVEAAAGREPGVGVSPAARAVPIH